MLKLISDKTKDERKSLLTECFPRHKQIYKEYIIDSRIVDMISEIPFVSFIVDSPHFTYIKSDGRSVSAQSIQVMTYKFESFKEFSELLFERIREKMIFIIYDLYSFDDCFHVRGRFVEDPYFCKINLTNNIRDILISDILD